MRTGAPWTAALLAAAAILLAAARPLAPAGREPVVLRADSPLVSLRLVFEVGSADDPAGKEGLNALTARLVAEGGTKELGFREVTERLYPMAAEMRAQADKDLTTILGRVHRDHLEPFVALFLDRVLEPRFDPEDFARHRDALRNAVARTLRSDDDEELGKHALEALLYRDHPYGHPTAGTVRGLEAITLDDVRAFYRRHYTVEALRIGVAGALPDGFVERLRSTLEAKLPHASSERRPLPPPPPRGEAVEVLLVAKPSAEATAISIGLPLGVTRADEDFYPLLVATTYLGDHRTFNGVLMRKLRGERGLNYGDYAYVESFVQDGGSTFPLAGIARREQFFSIWIRPVAPENAHFAVRAAIRELRRLVEDGMSGEAFEATRTYLRHYSKLWVQSLDRRLGYLLDSRFYGTGFYIDEIDRRLAAMRVEEVNGALARHLDRWDLRVAIVAADAEALAAALRENRPSPPSYPTPTAEAIRAEDREIERYPLPVGDVRVVPVSEMFER